LGDSESEVEFATFRREDVITSRTVPEMLKTDEIWLSGEERILRRATELRGEVATVEQQYSEYRL